MAIGAAFNPSVIVVTPGTTVNWHNGDGSSHRLTGGVPSRTIAPTENFARAFVKPGTYRYADAANPAIKGTVIVARRAKGTRRATGAASRFYSGTMTLRIAEHYRFYDSQWRSTQGACNAEVGNGSRLLTMRVALPKVRYFRSNRVESLGQRRVKATFVRYAELVSGNTTNSGSPEVTCQDGTTTDQTANVSVNCFKDYAGRTARGTFAWSPSSTGNRFEFASSSPSLSRCGTSYAGILEVLSVPRLGLPLNLVDRRFAYNGISTSQATAAELRALRAGRPVHVVRRVALDFTTGCCDGYAPQGEADTRVGTVHEVTGSLTINLRPR